MEEFLNFVIQRLVDYPDEVIITRHEQRNKVQFFVKLRQTDVGKIIGRNGHVIEAIRELVSAAASRQNLRATVDVID